MTRQIHFTVYGAAQPAGSKRAYVRAGRAVVVDANENSRPWKQEVAGASLWAMRIDKRYYEVPLEGPLEARFLFIVERPKGHTGKRGLLPSAPAYPTVRPDLLKLARGAEDAMTGIVYKDDSQIVTEHLEKRYGIPARAEITIRTLE